MVYLWMRPQVLWGQDAQISALSLNADVHSGWAACSSNRYITTVVPPVRRAMTRVQLGALQRWCPSWRALKCGSKKTNKASGSGFTFRQTLGLGYQYVGAVHVVAETAGWEPSSSAGAEVILCVQPPGCGHSSFGCGLLEQCPSAACEVLSVCCPVIPQFRQLLRGK